MITRDDSSTVFTGAGAPVVVDNQLQPIPGFSGTTSISVLGSNQLWPEDGLSKVQRSSITVEV